MNKQFLFRRQSKERKTAIRRRNGRHYFTAVRDRSATIGSPRFSHHFDFEWPMKFDSNLFIKPYKPSSTECSSIRIKTEQQNNQTVQNWDGKPSANSDYPVIIWNEDAKFCKKAQSKPSKSQLAERNSVAKKKRPSKNKTELTKKLIEKTRRKRKRRETRTIFGFGTVQSDSRERKRNRPLSNEHCARLFYELPVSSRPLEWPRMIFCSFLFIFSPFQFSSFLPLHWGRRKRNRPSSGVPCPYCRPVVGSRESC